MNKKIILLTLSALSVMAFVLPATAMAVEEDIPLHAIPKPEKATPITGGATSLSSLNGQTTDCSSVSGNATWESTTTGKLTLTYSGCKATTLGEPSCSSPGEPSGSIVTTELPFHLVTAEHPVTGAKVPAILITPKEGHFFTKTCSFLTFKVTGTGLIGRIESPACGGSSNTMNIVFEITKHGEQTYRTVVGTPNTEYDLLCNGETAAQTGTVTVTFAQSTKLECT
ncbi:MAG: hypothetical protein ACTHN3_11100 [Solirubrobacterales bacterium]